MLAGNPTYTIPTDYESIATVTVGSGGAANVEFTSIPGTYTHLQIRGIAKDDGGTANTRFLVFRFNSDTGSNYAWHTLQGEGSVVNTNDGPSENYAYISGINEGTANVFTAFVIDILDYANTNKYKTARGLGGFDANGSGLITFNSSLWQNTNAITSITLDARATLLGNFEQYSHFALYGIRGA